MLWLSHWKKIFSKWSFPQLEILGMSSSRKARVPTQVLSPWSQGYIACLSLLGPTNLILFFSLQQSFHVMASKSNYKCKLLSYKNSFSQCLLRVGTYLYTTGKLSWPWHKSQYASWWFSDLGKVFCLQVFTISHSCICK